MTDSFSEFLQQRLHNMDPFQREVMRHEMSAAANRQKIAGSNQGVFSFDTDRWMWLVAAESASAPLNAQFGNLQILIVSALQDGDIELFQQAKHNNLILDSWEWADWADNYEGSAEDLLQRLNSISEVRQVAGAACLACTHNPNAVSSALLERYTNIRIWSLVFHRLLNLGLQSDNAPEIAHFALELFTEKTDLLFVVDVDHLLSKIIRTYQGDDLLQRLKFFERAMVEDSRVALAEYFLNRNQYEQALKTVADIRLISPALPRAALVSALAALELGNAEKAQCYVQYLEDNIVSLKIQTRIAQLQKNHAAELAALTDLHELCPDDGDTFIQLLAVLQRIGQHEILTQLCLKHQESFLDNKHVMNTIARYLQPLSQPKA